MEDAVDEEDREHEEEQPVVAFPDAVVDVKAVVVELPDAGAADVAVSAALGNESATLEADVFRLLGLLDDLQEVGLRAARLDARIRFHHHQEQEDREKVEERDGGQHHLSANV